MGVATDADLRESKSNVEALRRIVDARRRELAALEALLAAWTGRPAGAHDPTELHRAIFGDAPLSPCNGPASHARPLADADADWVCWYNYELALVYLATRPPTRGSVVNAAVAAHNAAYNAYSRGFLRKNGDGTFELNDAGRAKIEQIKQRRKG